MSIEIRDVAKGFVTNATLVRRGRTMGRLVFLQVGFLPESISTFAASKWSLFIRDCLMCFECWFVWKYYTATNTLQWISYQMSWQRGILDITIVASEIVRVNHAKSVATSLALAFHHFVMTNFHFIQVAV